MSDSDLITGHVHSRYPEMVLVPTKWIQDKRLSWTARGLLVELISRDPGLGLPVDIDDALKSQASSPELFEAIDELVQAGYIHAREAA